MTGDQALERAGSLAFTYIVYVSIVVIACGHALLSVIVVTGFLTDHFPTWLSGSDRHNTLRNVIELLYFLANLGLVLVAILALRFARSQADHSRRQNDISTKAAQAAVYMRLVDKIGSSEMVFGGQLRHRIVKRHRLHGNGMPLGEFASREIVALAPEQRASFIDFLIFLEDIGLLARKRYLSMDDVFHLIEGPLNDFREVFLDHMEGMRTGSHQQRMCDNAIWLLKEIVDYRTEHPLPAEKTAPTSS